MDDLIAFLNARLDEDVAAAGEVYGHWIESGDGGIADRSYGAYLAVGPYGRPIDDATRTHMLRHDPARVLREVEAKRELIRHLSVGAPGRPLHMEIDGAPGTPHTPLFPEWLLRPFAAVYSDHPDYRDEWTP